MVHFGEHLAPTQAVPPQVVILCGGRGERLGDLTADRPKPMVEIGGRPILVHIMEHFARHGFDQFVLAVGHLGWVINDYFADREGHPESWAVRRVPTGWYTENGGRIRRVARQLWGQTFLMAWCDGLTDLDLTAMVQFHREHGKLCTVAIVRPPERFGSLEVAWLADWRGGLVVKFQEKGQAEQWINAGFFVCEPGVLDYINGDTTQWEREPMEHLAEAGELMAFAHRGFWQCMDTLKDQRALERLWNKGAAPWTK